MQEFLNFFLSRELKNFAPIQMISRLNSKPDKDDQ